MYDAIGLLRRNPRAVDLALALTLFFSMSLVGGLFQPQGHRWFDPWAYLLTGLICLPLVARRIVPMTVLVVTSFAYLAFAAAGYLPGLHLWSPVLAFYSLAAQRPPRATTAGAGLIAGVVLASCLAMRFPLVAAVAETVAVPAVAWVLGGLSRQLDQRNRQLAEATKQLRREHRRRVEQALIQERLRIARELHDVVAHHMSVVSMQAGLASYVFDDDPATARGAIETIGDTSREAMEEMRRLLNLLRETDVSSETGEPEPMPGLGELRALLDRVGAAGVDVELKIEGEVEDLPSGIQVTVYRVVQEALTNVIKHVGPCRAIVVTRREPRVLTVRITNEAPHATANENRGSRGYGLAGMRERTKLYRGSLTAGPTPEGGFMVELIVPLP